MVSPDFLLRFQGSRFLSALSIRQLLCLRTVSHQRQSSVLCELFRMHRLRTHHIKKPVLWRMLLRSLSLLLCNVYSQEVRYLHRSLLPLLLLHSRLLLQHLLQILLPVREVLTILLLPVQEIIPVLALPSVFQGVSKGLLFLRLQLIF